MSVNNVIVNISQKAAAVVGLVTAALPKPYVDVRDYASFAAAITAIGSSKATLLIPNEQAVSAGITVPTNVSLHFLRGGSLAIATGVTVTINGDVRAGLFQIFSWAGTGKVVFGKGAAGKAYVQWWGATGLGASDETTGLQAALDACIGRTLRMGGHFKFTSLQLPPMMNLIGAAVGNTDPYGAYLECIASSGSAISLKDSLGDSGDRKRIRLENITLAGNANLDVGLDFQAAATVACFNITLKHVEIRAMTKSGSKAIYLKDASNVHMDTVIAKNGGINGYGLYLDCQYWNSGVCDFTNCAFGNVGQSTAGLYVTETANRLDGWVFSGCYFGGAKAVHFGGGSPFAFSFIDCHYEDNSATAGDAAIYLACDTYGLKIIGGVAHGFSACDYGVKFHSGTHKGLSILGLRLMDFTDAQVRAESGVTFLDSQMLGITRNNAVTGWSGTLTGVFRSGFSQNRIDLGHRLVHDVITTFPNGATTPSVSAGNVFKTGNTSSTSITNFTDPLGGQIIFIRIADGYTTLVHNAAYMLLAGAINWTPASGDSITFLYDGAKWIEISRSDNS